jgi:ubiquitin-like protein ATG12
MSAAPEKVIIRLMATGNAPILKQSVFKMSSSHQFSHLISFIRKQLSLKDGESLFCYVNASFAPTPDEGIDGLYRCFGADGNLTINYSLNKAWG